MHLVDRMTEPPATCLICGKGNTPNAEGTVGPFIDLERDVNWGDPTYICEDDAMRIGALVGMVTPDELEDLRLENKGLEKKLHDQAADFDLAKRRRVARAQAALEEVS
jgi:hypothetical protein